MIKAILPERGIDDFGSGAFGASRGSQIHKGIDWACYPGTTIESRTAGRVTKLGFPYTDEEYKYVEITDEELARHRYFYISPAVELGALIEQDEIIGYAQDIANKYNTAEKKMKNHIHYEILVKNEPVDPEEF